MVASALVTLSALVAGALAIPAPQPVAMPNFHLRSGNSSLSNLMRRSAPNYNQDYVASGASVQYTPNEAAGTFSVSYDTQDDFVVGLGWQPGDSNPITYTGTFSATGVGLLSVYGWSTNPLVEYYIMEDPIGYPANQGTQKGTLVSDGATYEIWEHQQVNQPSIAASSSTFNQYISIRQTPRTSGTVTVENHFKAWAAAGMSLGTLNYQVLAVESWSGSGSGSLTVTKGTASTSTGSGSGTGTGTGTGSGSGTGTGSGAGAAEYGQCGGTGWTGATTCASPYTCKVLNSYYSQCQ